MRYNLIIHPERLPFLNLLDFIEGTHAYEHEISFQETLDPTERASQGENVHLREDDQEMLEETTGQEQERCNKHHAQDKQQICMFSHSPLWQHPSLEDKTDEMTELL